MGLAKTEHLLRVVDPVDDTYRRQMNRQLTVQESRHKLARDVCHGKRGTIHQAYRDGMEDQLGALGLVLNAIVLWTTKCIDDHEVHRRRRPAEGRGPRDPRRGCCPALPAQTQESQPARPLQLHRQRPVRRRPPPAARPGRAGAGRGRRGRRLLTPNSRSSCHFCCNAWLRPGPHAPAGKRWTDSAQCREEHRQQQPAVVPRLSTAVVRIAGREPGPR